MFEREILNSDDPFLNMFVNILISICGYKRNCLIFFSGGRGKEFAQILPKLFVSIICTYDYIIVENLNK